MATSSQMARTSGTRQLKHDAHVAAAALACASVPISGTSVAPSAASPYLRPVDGLTSASTTLTTCLAMTGMDEKVVNISAPMSPLSVKHVRSTHFSCAGHVPGCTKPIRHMMRSSIAMTSGM